MRVEVTEARLRDGGYNLVEGDTVTVPDKIGRAWCAAGWAKDTEGEVETGERRVVGEVLKPTKARHTARTKEV